MKTTSKLELSRAEVIAAVDFYLNTHVFQAEAAQRVTSIGANGYAPNETYSVELAPRPLEPEATDEP